MTRRGALCVPALMLAMLLAPARPGLCLDPLPVVEQGPGFKTWALESERPLVKLEDALAGLRSTDRRTYEETLGSLGLQKRMVGRELEWPELEQPIEAKTVFLSFERRKLAVLSAPIHGRSQWLAVVLRQEGGGEAYWRAIQAFEFATDPVDGYAQDFPDINGEDIRFWLVKHIDQDDPHGRARVTSIFRYDEKRLRLVFHETSDFYRPAKFQGQALKMEQTLVFKGDQKILRKLTLKTYPFMRREEFDHYDGVQPPEAKPSKVSTAEESFAWNPPDFNFYDSRQELEKLVRSKSPLIRRDAARRLGEHMKTTHAQLEAAMLKDKDEYVRIQCAVALAAIGDPRALPSVEKALKNYNEPDEVREALQATEAKLKGAAPVAGAEAPVKKHKKHKSSAAAASPIAPETVPKISEKK